MPPNARRASPTVAAATARLRLREFRHGDLDAVAEMVADPDQMRFYPRPRTKQEGSAWIDRNLSLYQARGFGFWLVESVPRLDFLGYCGIRPLTIESVENIEIGWHTRKRSWGRGIATEAATVCRDLAFGRYGIARLVATIDPAHTASSRVADKIGMSREREMVLDGWRCVLYSIDGTTPRHA